MTFRTYDKGAGKRRTEQNVIAPEFQAFRTLAEGPAGRGSASYTQDDKRRMVDSVLQAMSILSSEGYRVNAAQEGTKLRIFISAGNESAELVYEPPRVLSGEHGTTGISKFVQIRELASLMRSSLRRNDNRPPEGQPNREK